MTDTKRKNDYAGDNGGIPAFDVVGGASRDGVRVLDNAYVISLDRITANEQIRKEFDQEELEELASDLKEQGLINPIRVQKQGDGYVIVAGERRYRAAQIAGWTEIPCIVADGDILTQISENIHRVNLNAIEEARAYQSAMEELELDGKGLAKRLNVSPTKITTTVRILKLQPEILSMVERGDLAKTAVREIQKIKDPDQQLEAARSYVEEGGVYELRAKTTKTAKAAKKPVTGIKKTATIDGINFTASCSKKRPIAHLVAAAREFADQLEQQIRGNAA